MTQTRPNSLLSQRALIRISASDGAEDIREFLQGLLTQDLNGVQPGFPQWSALLSAQGKRLFDFFLWADGDDILIDCERDKAEALAKRLKLYRLRRKIGIEVDADNSVHWALNAPDTPGESRSDPRLAAIGQRWIEVGNTGEPADDIYKAHRLSLGVTEGEAELGSDKTLWLECNAAELNGVSFTKGCYVGQENTARMNYRQKVNRRMVVVPITDADEKRQRIAYPELGLSVEHRRVDDINHQFLPDWLKSAMENKAS